MIAFEELKLALDESVKDFNVGENIIVSVRQYLPIKEKTEMLQYVITHALDDSTGCFSPLRLEVYFALGICRYYTDIEIDTAPEDSGILYDLLECNSILDRVFSCIPEDELKFMSDLVNDTAKDISRYNNSAAGIIRNMSMNTEDIDGQLSEILTKIKEPEALDALAAFKDMV